MKPPHKATPSEKEVKRLHGIGKAPDIIAIRVQMKISRVLSIIADPMIPAPVTR
jgi:hypothetical protein